MDREDVGVRSRWEDKFGKNHRLPGAPVWELVGASGSSRKKLQVALERGQDWINLPGPPFVILA